MSDKSGNEIHKAYMIGLFEGKKQVINRITMHINAEMDELDKQKEAYE